MLMFVAHIRIHSQGQSHVAPWGGGGVVALVIKKKKNVHQHINKF